jgi:hypothetical protein
MSSPRERRGAHRPAGLGLVGLLPWVLAAVAVLIVVAVASGVFAGPGAAPAAVTSASPAASTTGTKRPSVAPSRSAGTPSGSASSPTSGTSSSTGAVNRTLGVTVLNGTTRAGLAGRAATTLHSAGWTIRSTGNSTAGSGATTVYYGRADLQATAAAVAAALGGRAQLTESADFGSRRVTVVLGSDYTP